VDTVALGARPGFVFWGLVGLIAALHRVGNEERGTGNDER